MDGQGNDLIFNSLHTINNIIYYWATTNLNAYAHSFPSRHIFILRDWLDKFDTMHYIIESY